MHKKLSLYMHVLMLGLLFVGIFAILMAANFLSSLNHNPYDTLFLRLQPKFYLRTILIILFSSVLYTPVSYGISYYYWQGTKREVEIRDIWFLFTRWRMFGKAVLLRLAVWFLRGFYQILILLGGVIAETVLYILCLELKQDEMMRLTLRALPKYINAVLDTHNFWWFTVGIWSVILALLILTMIRFMFCKYALLRFPELSVKEALSIGVIAGRGRVWKVIAHYLSFLSYYIIIALSLGKMRKRIRTLKRSPFSLYAIECTERSRQLYFIGK